MRWLDSLLNRFTYHHSPDRTDELDAALRATARAQLRVATAADGVSDAAAEHRAKVDAVRVRISERAAVHEERRRKGQTSETLRLVRATLARPALGGDGGEAGDCDA